MKVIKKSIELFEKGLYKKAIKNFNSILKDNPIDDLIWRYKGEALAKLGNFNEAIDCYDKAIQILPDYMTETLWILKGRALIQCSEFDNAIKSFNQALEIKPDTEVAESEKQIAIKLKKEALKAVKEEQDAIARQVSDAFEINQKLRSKGIQSDILHKTLYDALRNENFKERVFEELVEMAKERHSNKDEPDSNK